MPIRRSGWLPEIKTLIFSYLSLRTGIRTRTKSGPALYFLQATIGNTLTSIRPGRAKEGNDVPLDWNYFPRGCRHG